MQIHRQRIVQRPHDFRIEHDKLFDRVFFVLLQLRPDLFDRIFRLLFQIPVNDGVENNICIPAYVVHALFAGEISSPVPLLLLFVRAVDHGTALALGGF